MTSNNRSVCQFHHGLPILGWNDNLLHLGRVSCVDTVQDTFVDFKPVLALVSRLMIAVILHLLSQPLK